MFDAFHISKDVDSVALIKTTVDLIRIGDIRDGRIGITWLQKEDIGSSVLGTQVDVAEDAGSNPSLSSVDENQTRIDVHDRRTLRQVSGWLPLFRARIRYHHDRCLVEDLGSHLVHQISIA